MASTSVWEQLREYAATQRGSFTSQEVISWFRRHDPRKVNDGTIRAHVRGASWNVGDRSQFSAREPFLTRTDRGVFRNATADEIDRWRAGLTEAASRPPAPTGTESSPSASATAHVDAAAEWHTEANVQSLLVAAMVADGWRIRSVANTATKEHGIDVIAERDGTTVGVEVKGYPSRHYADPARAGEVKKTQPSNQASHWYAQAMLAAFRLRGKEPGWRSVIALPAFPRFQSLYAETAGSLDAAGVEVWWVEESGRVGFGDAG